MLYILYNIILFIYYGVCPCFLFTLGNIQLFGICVQGELLVVALMRKSERKVTIEDGCENWVCAKPD